MKLTLKLFSLILLLAIICLASNVSGDKALADKLKPFAQFSSYDWTKWVELRQPIAAPAAISTPFAPSDDSDDSEDETADEVANWLKRAILPEPASSPLPKKSGKKSKESSDVDTTTKKPLVELPPGFWGPPPTIAPNVTVPPPPGYWAAKKSMFVSKLFAALAASVINSTGAPVPEEITTTTLSPKQLLLDELSEVLLSDTARALPEKESKEESGEDGKIESSDEESEEEISETEDDKTAEAEFIAKLTKALASEAKKTSKVNEPATSASAKSSKVAPSPSKKAVDAKKSKGGKTKASKVPKFMKYVPTTPAPAPAFDYDALAKALLGK